MTEESPDKNINVRLKNLNKSYEEAGKSFKIIENLSATFNHNEVVALIGKSGSGKTTLLNLISGIDRPDSGEVWIGGTFLNGLSERDLTLIRRNNIGIVFQFFNLIPTLTVIENVCLPGDLNNGHKSHNIGDAGELLSMVGLGNRLNSYPDVLSGGEQQRVAIARALINDPEVILADEPTGNLDEDTAGEVLKLLLTLARETGKTMIIATHSNEIIQFADTVYSVHNGQLIPES